MTIFDGYVRLKGELSADTLSAVADQCRVGFLDPSACKEYSLFEELAS